MIPAKKFFYALITVNAILLGLLAGAFLLNSNIAAHKSKTIGQLKADVETNTQAINSYNELSKVIKQNKDVSTIANKVLPRDSEQTTALAELDKFSKDSGVTIKEITFISGKSGLTSPSSLKGVSVLTVSVNADNAQYSQLLDLLKKIENNQRRMQVTSVTLTPSTSVAGQLDHIGLTMDIYLKPKS